MNVAICFVLFIVGFKFDVHMNNGYHYMWPCQRKLTMWAHLYIWEIPIWNIQSHVTLLCLSSCIRFTQEAQQDNSYYIVINNHISTCYLDLLVVQSFSDMVQNITSAAYKGVSAWVGVVRLTFRHNRISCVPKELSMVPKPHYKAKQAIW